MINRTTSTSQIPEIHRVVKSIALDEHEISIDFTNSYVENDVDCNATGSHFEHRRNTQHEYLKWVEKAEFNHFELQGTIQKECLIRRLS